MKDYKYLIVGGGMTADSAVRGIRQVDPEGSIGLISQENDPPYNRPPLSKGVWQGRPLERIFRRTINLKVEMYLGRKAVQLNPQTKTILDDSGDFYNYQKLLLATGGNPIQPPTFSKKVIYYRTLEDYRRLRDLVNQGIRFAVLGGGFIGSEIAAVLEKQGKQVIMIFREDGIGSRVFTKSIALALNDYYRQKEIQILTGRLVNSVEENGNQLLIKTNQQDEIEVDGVVAGLGIRPNIELAHQAGLAVDNGIIVNSYLQTSQEDIYAAGDVMNSYNSSLAKRMRVEHEENANLSGLMAGKNMAGTTEKYDYLPYFYADLFDLSYEGVGEMDPSLEVIEDWIEPFRQGVLFYTKAGRVRGVMLWKIQGKIEAARQMINSSAEFQPSELIGKFTH